MNTRSLAIVASFALVASGSCAHAQLSIPWFTIDAGAGTSNGGALSLSGTIGQHDAAATMSGGTFSIRGGFWASNPSCPADFNLSGSVTVQDIFDFLTAWNASSPSADFNGVGGVTVQDIFDFLTAWNTSCP